MPVVLDAGRIVSPPQRITGHFGPSPSSHSLPFLHFARSRSNSTSPASCSKKRTVGSARWSTRAETKTSSTRWPTKRGQRWQLGRCTHRPNERVFTSSHSANVYIDIDSTYRVTMPRISALAKPARKPKVGKEKVAHTTRESRMKSKIRKILYSYTLNFVLLSRS